MSMSTRWDQMYGPPPAPDLEPPADDVPPYDEPPADEETPRLPRRYEATDHSNAHRLVDAHPDDLRYCPQRRMWLTWDGHRWRWDQAGVVVEHARQVAHDLPRDEFWKGWRKKSLMQPRINAMIALARSDTAMVVHAADLDRRGRELNTPAGVVHLPTGQLRDPDPAALHTRSTTVAPDMDAVPTRWLQFLATTFSGQPELTTYVQRLLGVSLVGEVLEQLFPVCHGQGRNGKGVLLDVVQAVLGKGDEGYSAQAAAELILAGRFPGHPTELARLNGARFVVTSEVDRGQRFAEARLKLLTGGDTINARFMHKDFFDFTPTHSLWLRTNEPPEASAGDYALWQRLRLIPFAHIVPPEERDKELAVKLIEHEGPAILGWLITGARDYFAHGLGEPQAVTVATQAYERDQDTVARFVDERCQTGEANAPHLVVQSSRLYAAYEKWCSEEGDEAVTQKAFTRALTGRFAVIADHTRTGTFLHGIRLDDIDTDEQPPAPPEPVQQEIPPWPGYPATPDPEKGDSRWT